MYKKISHDYWCIECGSILSGEERKKERKICDRCEKLEDFEIYYEGDNPIQIIVSEKN